MTPSARIFLKKLIDAILLMLFVIMIGTLGYKFLFPEVSLINCVFSTVITISTVGFEDLLGVSGNPIAMFFTIGLIAVGGSIVLYALSVLTAMLVEGYIHSIIMERNAKRRVAKMKDHVIICGAGTTSYHVVERLYSEGTKMVVIDSNSDNVEKLQRNFKKMPVLLMDATSDESLKEANIENAHTLVATLASDKDNLFVTITARMMNPGIQVISRAIDFNLQDKFMRAGSSYVVSPNYLGGENIANRIINPNIQGFLENIINKDKSKSINLFTIKVPFNSKIEGKTLAESQITKKTGINIISYSPNGNMDNFIFNPSADLEVYSGGMLLFIGSQEQKEELEKLVSA